jgi:TolA-binding protein
MMGQRFLGAAMVASALAFAAPAGAQTQTAAQAGAQTVSSADIQRLQDDVYQAGSDISRLRSSDATEASRLQDELDDLRDEVTYLKVKLRREGNVNRADYADIRDRLQNLRARARGDSQARPGWSSSSPSSSSSSNLPSPPPPGPGTSRESSERPSTTRRSTAIPAGQEIDVRLERELNSGSAQVEDRFEATTVVDMYDGNRVIIPAGSVMRGVVSSVDKATRTDRKGSMTVAFDQVTVRGRDYPLRGTVSQAIESEGIRGEVGKIGAGSAVGAVIGGIIGGVKGAVLGVLIGGGGTMVATEGKDVSLPPGTILRVRLDTPPDIR